MQRGTLNLAVFLHGLEARATEFRTVPRESSASNIEIRDG